MEHFKGIFINDIVQDFKRISVPVKTDKQIPGIKLFLPIAVVKPFVVQNIVKSCAYTASLTPCLKADRLNLISTSMISVYCGKLKKGSGRHPSGKRRGT
jgi:hypothetical protein